MPAAGPRRPCQRSRQAATQSIPTRIVVKPQMEKKGRGGKTVTVVDNLPNNAAFLKELCQDLKRSDPAAPSRTARSSFRGSSRSRPRAVTARGMTVKG